MRYQRRRRAGFTIVEMLVATALVLVIMLIISQAFASASKTFRTMKAAGEGQEKLRGAITILRKDLGSDHFGPPYGSARGGPRLSDQRLDQAGWQPPYAGYFEFRQRGDVHPVTGALLPSLVEPVAGPITDGEGLTSTRATRNTLRFTVRLPDGAGAELFTALFDPVFTTNSQANAFVNGQSLLYTRWAEVAYFLSPTRDPEFRGTGPGGTGLPMHTLRRRLRLLPPRNVDLGPMPVANALAIVQRCTQFADVITPIITGPPNANGQVIVRLPGPESLNAEDLDYTQVLVNPNSTPIPVGRVSDNPRAGGEDIVMTDVISFDVKAAWFHNPAFNEIVRPMFPSPPNNLPSPPCSPAVQPITVDQVMRTPPIMALGNMDEPFSDLYPSFLLPGGQRWFDTGDHKLVAYDVSPNPWPVDPADWDQPGTFIPPTITPGFLTPRQTTVPTRINIRALQIKLRVWNPRYEQARQSTIVVDM